MLVTDVEAATPRATSVTAEADTATHKGSPMCRGEATMAEAAHTIGRLAFVCACAVLIVSIGKLQGDIQLREDETRSREWAMAEEWAARGSAHSRGRDVAATQREESKTPEQAHNAGARDAIPYSLHPDVQKAAERARIAVLRKRREGKVGGLTETDAAELSQLETWDAWGTFWSWVFFVGIVGVYVCDCVRGEPLCNSGEMRYALVYANEQRCLLSV